ncbi:MAG: hypothetical protein EHM49_05475 [Deltaproteobacteria bacterium]|nr:MAG: hypothetical protein EHM49_05475 [Deltaproteobacteria bacterium]
MIINICPSPHLGGKPTALDAPNGISIHGGDWLRTRLWICRLFPIAILLSFVGIFLFGCATGYIRDYQPKSSAEEAIKETLISFETAWNNHTEEALLALFDEDFTLWVWRGGNRQILFTKGRFGFRLWEVFIRLRYLSLGEPRIGIKDNEARVYLPLSVDGRSHQGNFTLVNRDGKWLFLEWEFY